MTTKPQLAAARATMERLRAAGSDSVTPIGVAPLPDRPVVVPQPPDTPFHWLVLRLEHDPLYRRRQLSIPRSQRQRLQRLDRAGISFDELLIGHEVAKERLTDIKADSLDTKAINTALASSPPIPTKASAALGTTLRAAGIAALLPFALLVAPIAVIAATADPVLLGAITVDRSRSPGTLAALFLIARW